MQVSVFPAGQRAPGMLLMLPPAHWDDAKGERWFAGTFAEVAETLDLPPPVVLLSPSDDSVVKSLKQLRRFDGGIVFAQSLGKRAEEKQPPFPPRQPVVGNALQFIHNTHLQYLETARTLGPVFELHYFNFRFLVVSDPDLMAAFMEETPYFTKKVSGTAFEEVKELGGEGLFTTDTMDRSWAKAHALLLPAFSHTSIQSYVPRMVEISESLVAVWKQLGFGNAVNIKEWMTRVTFEVIGACGFSFCFNMLDGPDAPLHPFIQGMNRCLGEMQKRAFRTRYWKKLPIKANKQFRVDTDLMFRTVEEVIANRFEERKSGKKSETPDLLDFMLDAVDGQTGEGFTASEMRDEIITFLIAGHETTSSLLSWTIMLLDKHPDIEQRVLAEIQSVCPDGEAVTLAAVKRMPFLFQVIREAIRLYPPLPRVQKMCLHPTQIGPYAVKAGDVCEANILALHRLSAAWGPDAACFNPDRFSPENDKERHPFAFLPFSHGPRSCIGAQFAFLEARVVLAVILPVFRFNKTPNTDTSIDARAPALQPTFLEMTLQPRNGPDVTVDRVPVPQSLQEPQSLPPMIVAVMSDDGQSEDLAVALAGMAESLGISVQVVRMSEYVASDHADPHILVALVANDPAAFSSVKAWALGDPTSLAHIKYGVLSVTDPQRKSSGRSSLAHLIDSKLFARGGERLCDMASVSIRSTLWEDFGTWQSVILTALLEKAPALHLSRQVQDRDCAPRRVAIEQADPKANEAPCRLPVVASADPSNSPLTEAEFSLAEPFAGDPSAVFALQIWPTNQSVESIASVLGLSCGSSMRVSLPPFASGLRTEWAHGPTDQTISVGRFLREFADLDARLPVLQGSLRSCTALPAGVDAAQVLENVPVMPPRYLSVSDFDRGGKQSATAKCVIPVADCKTEYAFARVVPAHPKIAPLVDDVTCDLVVLSSGPGVGYSLSMVRSRVAKEPSTCPKILSISSVPDAHRVPETPLSDDVFVFTTQNIAQATRSRAEDILHHLMSPNSALVVAAAPDEIERCRQILEEVGPDARDCFLAKREVGRFVEIPVFV